MAESSIKRVNTQFIMWFIWRLLWATTVLRYPRIKHGIKRYDILMLHAWDGDEDIPPNLDMITNPFLNGWNQWTMMDVLVGRFQRATWCLWWRAQVTQPKTSGENSLLVRVRLGIQFHLRNLNSREKCNPEAHLQFLESIDRSPIHTHCVGLTLS